MSCYSTCTLHWRCSSVEGIFLHRHVTWKTCTKSDLLVCGLMWGCPIWSTDSNSVDLFACQELPMLGVLLNLSEFSAHIVFYMPTYGGSFCLFSCASHILCGWVFFPRGSNFRILNWTLDCDKLIFQPKLNSERHVFCSLIALAAVVVFVI